MFEFDLNVRSPRCRLLSSSRVIASGTELPARVVQGVIVIPNVLPQQLVQHMNSVIDGACADGIIEDERNSDRFNFTKVAALDPAFLETMASPTTLEVIRVMCGDWLRLDHACAFRPTPSYPHTRFLPRT